MACQNDPRAALVLQESLLKLSIPCWREAGLQATAKKYWSIIFYTLIKLNRDASER